MPSLFLDWWGFTLGWLLVVLAVLTAGEVLYQLIRAYWRDLLSWWRLRRPLKGRQPRRYPR